MLGLANSASSAVSLPVLFGGDVVSLENPAETVPVPFPDLLWLFGGGPITVIGDTPSEQAVPIGVAPPPQIADALIRSMLVPLSIQVERPMACEQASIPESASVEGSVIAERTASSYAAEDAEDWDLPLDWIAPEELADPEEHEPPEIPAVTGSAPLPPIPKIAADVAVPIASVDVPPAIPPAQIADGPAERRPLLQDAPQGSLAPVMPLPATPSARPAEPPAFALKLTAKNEPQRPVEAIAGVPQPVRQPQVSIPARLPAPETTKLAPPPVATGNTARPLPKAELAVEDVPKESGLADSAHSSPDAEQFNQNEQGEGEERVHLDSATKATTVHHGSGTQAAAPELPPVHGALATHAPTIHASTFHAPSERSLEIVASKAPTPTAEATPVDLQPKPEMRSGSAREIAIRISPPDASPVDVQVKERGGEVHVAVRTA